MNNANALITIGTAQKQGHYAPLGQILLALNLGLTTDWWAMCRIARLFCERQTYSINMIPRPVYTAIDLLLSNAITSLGASDRSAFQPAGMTCCLPVT